jgi:Cu2+-exporting ATPase
MTALIGTGEFIRERTSRRCEKMVTDLLGLSGRSAWLIRGKKRILVAADEVKVGEMVVIYPGDMVPVDGAVVSGEAAIDQAKLTGEAIPVEVKSGDKVFASTVLVEGKIYVRCQATGSETKAGQVLQCVNNAPIHETKIQNHASAIADKAVVPIFLIAGVCFAITGDVSRLMSMLILDFCTGIRIAAPTAVLSSMHRAGRRGILIKSGAALENLAQVTAIVFDKTGTLTSGEPKVEQVSRFNGHTEHEILALAAAVEMRLHHPAARAIVKHAQQEGLTIPDRTTSKFLRGMGAKAIVGEHEVLVGSKNLMTTEGIVIDDARESENQATKLGESIAYVAIDGKVAGLIRYSDKLRPEVVKAIKELKKLRVRKLVMATGDIEQAANRIAKICGITEVIARAFPEDKAKLVQELKAAGHVVAVIGDGINDSPALAYADVAISLHGATDAAQQSADIVLTDDNLERLPEAIRIARSAMALVKQNLAMAIVPNAAGFAMAAAGILGPAGATILNNGSAITAAINSLRPLYSNTWSTVDPIEQTEQTEN